ncbi:MAG: hypothetical protein ACXWWU_09850 [Candidatus Limnocylindria bacterium]
MSVAIAEMKRTGLTSGEAGRSAARLFEPSGWTLEDVILGVWEDLTAGNPAECPVCHGTMRITSGCQDCGSELT